MKICIVGVGGVGGYFGGKLAYTFQDRRDSKVEVYFVARGQHLEMIRKNGLLLRTSDQGELRCRPRLVTDHFQELPDMDFLIIAVKGYDLDGVAQSLSRKASTKTVILPLLNGVDIRERLRRHVKNGIILPACVYLSAFIEGPGVVSQVGNPGRLIIGPDPDHDYQPAELLRIFQEASILHQWTRDALSAIWEKYVFIAGYGLVTARFDKPLGEIYEDPSLSDLVSRIMEEIREIARAKRIPLPSDIVEVSLKKAQLFPRDTQTSLQRDVNQKKGRSELDLFGRTVIEEGLSLGVPTPVTKRIYDELLPIG